MQFYATVPFGFTADEQVAWLYYGGGQDLWDVLSAQFDLKCLLCGTTGSQMAGWFTHEVASPDAFKGLRYRMAGPGAEVLRRLGATVVTLPGSEIMPALKSGAIEASEWIGPWLDVAIGLQTVAPYYYYPGFHEPAAGQTFGINRAVWESFDTNDRQVIEAMVAADTLAPSRNSTQTMRSRCASCAKKVPSRS